MMREDCLKEILRLIAEHDGQWYWYQIDRALCSHADLDCIGPFIEELQALADEKLIEVRPDQTIDEHERYWLTEKGRQCLVELVGIGS